MVATVVERAKSGAAFLDEHVPGWFGRIDVAELDVASGRRCLLGQLFGTFGSGLAALSIEAPGKLGFSVGPNREEINEAWREEVAKRKLAAMPTTTPTEVLV